MKAEISNGELLDKFSILQIKLDNIQDPNKIANIRNEFSELEPDCVSLLADADTKELFNKLKEINRNLWKIEDDIRELEEKKEFKEDFIQLARAVYFTNDMRAELKKRINLHSGSSLVEEKSYKGSL